MINLLNRTELIKNFRLSSICLNSKNNKIDDSFINQNKNSNSKNLNFNSIFNFFDNLSNDEDLSKDLRNKKNIKSGDKIEEHKKPTKFFIDYNSEIKCFCNKTKCLKKYCECFYNNRFCVNCECLNCLNKLPKNSECDVHQNSSHLEKNDKPNNLICICAKNRCILNYCKCFKNGIKCSTLCRCKKCQNTAFPKEVNALEIKICHSARISIINNIIKDHIKKKKYYGKFLNKKRKYPEKYDENYSENENKNIEDENSNDRLFDQTGNLIFSFIKLSEI